ncbi:MAG: hypothetical protein FWC62_02125 [Firmicutes bacterium]|nr:hypothetical protein [Bacillota bacterium]
MLALIIIVIVLLALMLLPVGVDALYDGDVGLKIKAGPFRMTLLGGKKKEKPKKKKKPKEKKPKKEEQKKKKKPPDIKLILGLVKLGFRALNRFRRKLSVDFFALHFTAAAADPYAAAMLYGRLSAAFETVLRLVGSAFRVTERDVALDVDFEAESPKIYARLILTIQIWQILYIGLAFGAAFLRLWLRRRKENRAKERKEEHGKQHNQRSDERINGQDQGDGGRQHRHRRADHYA